MTVLSVNVNKFALIRNSRGQNTPDLIQIATQCLSAGVAGITVHPRPDGRHIRWDDVAELATLVKDFSFASRTERSVEGEALAPELNIEGYPSPDFIEKVLEVTPAQVTLVPDPPEALTSSFGWDINYHHEFLKEVVATFKAAGIRASLFMDPSYPDFSVLTSIDADRVELFTYDYAKNYSNNPHAAIRLYVAAAKQLEALGIELNAGHDLSLENLGFFISQIPSILEVSIGHALVCESLQLGLPEVLKRYQAILNGI